MDRITFLKELYFKTLTPFEVLDFSKKNKCIFEKNEQKYYLDFWKKCLSKENSDVVFKNYCNHNNLNQLDLDIMLSKIKNIEGVIKFPLWVIILDNILNEVKTSDFSDESSHEEYLNLLQPFLNYCKKNLSEKLFIKEINVNRSVINHLINILYKDLYNYLKLVIIKELQEIKSVKNGNNADHYKEFVNDTLKDNYVTFFLKYPLLAKKLSVKTLSHINSIFTIISKFYDDKVELQNLFNENYDDIKKLYLNSGDCHNGQSTAILEFQNLKKIVYKPTNVKITNVYNNFIKWTNENLDENLKIFKVLDKGNYGWLQFVENPHCDTICQVQNYYKRAGILLGIAYFLNSKDYHFENVIASGDSPVLIDHETIINPLLDLLEDENHPEEDKILNTVLESSLIPVKFFNLPYHMYGFGDTSKKLIPKQNLNNISGRENVRTQINDKNNLPIYQNNQEYISAYKKYFMNGFKEFYNLILNNKLRLENENPLISNFSNNNIRFINRQSKTYYKILKFLNKPEYLSNSIKYGLKLEILARAYLIKNNWSPIIDSEREQMLQDNIPIFQINSTDDIIRLPNNKFLNLVKHNAVDNIYNKISNASISDFNKQMFLINQSIN